MTATGEYVVWIYMDISEIAEIATLGIVRRDTQDGIISNVRPIRFGFWTNQKVGIRGWKVRSHK